MEATVVYKPKFHLARHVSTGHDSTRSNGSTCRYHAFWLYLVEQHGSTHSTRRARLARHVERVVSCRSGIWGILIFAAYFARAAFCQPADRGLSSHCKPSCRVREIFDLFPTDKKQRRRRCRITENFHCTVTVRPLK